MSEPIPDYLDQPGQNLTESWLKSLGFSRGNPFANVEADQERLVLPEFFVDVDGYDQIKGNKSIIVFAPRGGGKSALKVVLASYAAPIQAKATTLAVEFTDFDGLITKQQSGQKLTIDDHVTHLLRATMKTLWEFVCGHHTDKAIDKQRTRAERAVTISMPIRIRLAQLIRLYCPTLLTSGELYKYFESLHPEQSIDWPVFLESVRNRCLRRQILSQLPNLSPVIHLLADLNDAYDLAPDPLETPTNKISELVQLCRGMGIQVVHFLIDRLDENIQMADDPNAQVAMLEPLLAHLPILEMPNVAFKFFLAQEVRHLLMDRPSIRRDRLTDRAVTVEWKVDNLKKLLDERIEVYSNRAIHDLPSLFADKRINTTSSTVKSDKHLSNQTSNVSEASFKQSGFALGMQVEKEALQIAQGSPRRLLLAAQLLCQAHVQRTGPHGLLDKEDWEIAKAQLMQKMPPLLRLNRNERVVLIGERSEKVSPLEHSILLTLAKHLGQCSRDELIKNAWEAEDGVNDQAVDSAISRLRKKIADDPHAPIYLITELGRGFILRNYELE